MVSFGLSYIGATVGLVLGQLRVALLVYALGSPAAGAATSLAISTAGTLTGTWRHARDGRVSLWLLASVGAPSAVAAFATARWAGSVDARLLKAAIAGVLLLTGAAMLRRRPEPAGPSEHVPSRTFAVLAEVVVGAVLGAISGLVGLLLGSLRLPAMIRYARVPPPVAVGTNMAIGAVTGLSAGVATFLQGQVDLTAFAVVTPLTLLGANLGARRTGDLDPDSLRRWIAWILLLSAALMLGELGLELRRAA
ncbi:sulfite exporter TauE/SafE family protein [Nannocystis sp. RBIL2]|uniref:sulfite exporter TauE/SafE family protein n=1 Tax=Nannocystis sp. RBIL2 TaxID=2996788 RepID=UPI002270D4A9|nr:sulfite exporter TauE/SafE family protein [Nannocystis sp. RBIL2]MCY1063628.1 sulfite exporter TauE/SafE family protein [Nannocystis sp. RBIL2]